MSDPFKLLGLPKKLALSPQLIDQAYQEANQRLHPDRGGKVSEYDSMREAADLLKSPARRLRWALSSRDSEWNERGSVPESVMNLFSPIAEALQEVERFSLERSRAKSAMGRAVLDSQSPTIKKKLEELLANLQEEEARLISSFQEFDEQGWDKTEAAMAESARGLSFLEKWQGQIRAATGKLFQALLEGAE